MDDKQRAKERKKRRRAHRRKKFFKNLLIIIGIIAVAFAAFVITLKVCDPDFKLESLIPKKQISQVSSFIKEDILGKTTEAATQAPTTTKPTTTKRENYDYSEFDDFAFDTSLQGNQLGNLLNKTQGAVTYNSSYIYYSIAGAGIYRFEPNSETNSKVEVKSYNFKCLNILGDYVYYVDKDSNKLKRADVSGSGSINICDNIDFAYLYNDKVYFVGTDNSVGYINLDGFEKNVIYTAPADKKVSFVGISLTRVFFTQHDSVADYTEYITVDVQNKSKRYFRNDTKNDEIVNMQLECGFFYYYQKQTDGSYNLIRQKFGSEKTVTLVEKCTLTDYPVVYANRLYYTDLKNSTVYAKELNMNSMQTKNMLHTSNADSSSTVGIGYGYQYVFLFGSPTANSAVQYRGSCIYTSASTDNIIKFSKGKWSY